LSTEGIQEPVRIPKADSAWSSGDGAGKRMREVMGLPIEKGDG